MGEYAIRKSDGQKIKIGTCDSMYYLRYSDRDKVRALPGNVDVHDQKTVNQLRFRLPFPDEDHIRPGEYQPFRGASLCNFSDKETAGDPGLVQLTTKTGMLVNVSCYHGEKLPENTKEAQFHWNGKDNFYNLTALKFINGDVFGIYECVDCRHMWRAPLKELIPFMIAYEDQPLKARLIEWYLPEMKKGL